MLTPQEVSERAFQKASFGGYNMAQVDEFLDILTGDYTALFNENAVLKSKMKVLVEKVEEYRSTEEAMRKALMTAQRMADDLVQDAQRKKDAMLKEAEAEISSRISSISQEVEAENFRLQQAQKSTAEFVEKIRAMHIKQMEYLEHLQSLTPPQAAPETDPVEETASEIDDNVQRLLAQAMKDATAENLRAKTAEQAQSEAVEEPSQDIEDTAEFSPVANALPHPHNHKVIQQDEDLVELTSGIDFDNLQFGRDYEIK